MHSIDPAEPSLASSLSAGVAMACVGGLVASWVYLTAGLHNCHSPITRARQDEQEIESYVSLYRIERPDAPCPSVKDLVREHVLHSSAPLFDPWNEPYRIECFGEADAEVRSAGPDRVFATSDDVT
jgi:hypothetical protein